MSHNCNLAYMSSDLLPPLLYFNTTNNYIIPRVTTNYIISSVIYNSTKQNNKHTNLG